MGGFYGLFSLVFVLICCCVLYWSLWYLVLIGFRCLFSLRRFWLLLIIVRLIVVIYCLLFIVVVLCFELLSCGLLFV